jgi:hypothetical protein
MATLTLVPKSQEQVPQPHGPCTAPGCLKPTRLYPGGWRCDDHKARPFTSDILGQDPREAA